MIVSMASLEKE